MILSRKSSLGLEKLQKTERQGLDFSQSSEPDKTHNNQITRLLLEYCTSGRMCVCVCEHARAYGGREDHSYPVIVMYQVEAVKGGINGPSELCVRDCLGCSDSFRSNKINQAATKYKNILSFACLCLGIDIFGSL